VICINIIDFELLETENFHSVFHLREDRESHIALTDALEIHFIDMVKWRRLKDKDIANNPLHRWLAWFDEASPPKLIEEVTNMDSAIKTANDRQTYVSSDVDTRRLYEMRELARLDWNSSIKYARREGLKEGMEKGEKEGKIEIARNALAKGLSTELIHDITGLDPQTIEKLS